MTTIAAAIILTTGIARGILLNIHPREGVAYLGINLRKDTDMNTASLGDGLGKRRRRRRTMGQLPTLVGRRKRRGLAGRGASGCSAAGVKANGRLKKGYRWAKGRKSCAIRAKR